jgi:hypothetical protein
MKYIENSKNYFVDINGDVFKGTRKLNKNKSHSGYLTVTISYTNGLRKVWYVHRLIATMFIPNPDNCAIVNHKNLHKNDNRVNNLEWVTHKQNSQHAIDNGALTDSDGSRLGSTYSTEQVIQVCNMLQDNMRNADIHRITNIPKGTIDSIRRGKQWLHISENYTFNKSSRQLKVSVSTIEWVCRQIVLGLSNTEIEDITTSKLTRQDIWKIRNKMLYKDISNKFFN